MKTLSTLTAAIALIVGAGAANATDVYSGATGGLKDAPVLAGNPFAGFNGSIGAGLAYLGDSSGRQTDFRGDTRAGYNFVSRDGFLVGVYAEGSLIDTQQNNTLWGYGAGLKVGKVLGGMFLGYAWQLWRHYSDALARRTFRFSIWHLSLLFAALLVDHYIGPWLHTVVS